MSWTSARAVDSPHDSTVNTVTMKNRISIMVIHLLPVVPTTLSNRHANSLSTSLDIINPIIINRLWIIFSVSDEGQGLADLQIPDIETSDF